MAVGVPTPGTRAEWLRYEGRHAAVAAPPGSFAASRAPHVLEEAERTVLALQRLLEVPARQDTVRVDIVLVDAAPAPAGLPATAATAPPALTPGSVAPVVRAVSPEGSSEPLAQPMARALVAQWFGADAAAAHTVVRGLAGMAAARAGSGPALTRRRHVGAGPACRRHPPLAVHRAGGRPAAGAADHRVRRAGPDPRAPAPVGRPARLPPRGPRGGRRAARRTSARGLVRRRPRAGRGPRPRRGPGLARARCHHDRGRPGRGARRGEPQRHTAQRRAGHRGRAARRRPAHDRPVGARRPAHRRRRREPRRARGAARRRRRPSGRAPTSR